MKKIILLLCLFSGLLTLRAQTDSLVVQYYVNPPYAFKEGSSLKGIETDILDEYIQWLKKKKNKTLIVTYKPFTEFSTFYNSVKEGGRNVVGLGSVTHTSAREKDVVFTAPYLRNVAVMITAGTVPTMKSREPAIAGPVFKKLNAAVVKESSHVAYAEEIKKKLAPGMKITFHETQDKVLENIISDPAVFGYVDIVAYWSFLKKNQGKFLKMQKAFKEPMDFMGFILPKNNTHSTLLNEFMESGFGFTSTKVYRQILEKYLGHEIIESVEIK
jgi:ABC-type amino acid transport substrate-binding protein